MVPARSSVTSRMDVDLSCSDGSGNTIPLVVANMTAVSGRRMAETVSRRGGLSVIPQDIPTDVVARRRGLRQVAAPRPRHRDHRGPDRDRRRHADPAAEAGPRRRCRRRRAPPPDRPGHRVRPHRRRPVHPGPRRDEPRRGHHRRRRVGRGRLRPARHARHRLAPAVDADGRLVGILTRQGALRATVYRPNVDAHDRLRVAAAVGINGDVVGRAKELAAAGIDLLVVDTAHGHQEKMLEALRAVRDLGLRDPDLCGQCRCGPRGSGPRRGRRRHRQGRGRARARCARRG